MNVFFINLVCKSNLTLSFVLSKISFDFLSIRDIFGPPIAYFFSIFSKGLKKFTKKLNKAIFITIVLLCIYINLSIEYYYDGCFYGGTWDFHSFIKLLHF
mgnify:CR=1 FL=1